MLKVFFFMLVFVVACVHEGRAEFAEYYYARDGEPIGPISRERLLEMLEDGRLDWENLIWTDGMPDWAPAYLVPLGIDEAETTATRPPTTSAAPLRFKQINIIDQGGFNQPMRAASTLIPSDWTAEGGIVWTFEDCAKGYGTQWKATSPDGRVKIEVYPTQGWMHFNFDSTVAIPPGCTNLPIESAIDFLAAVVASNGGRIVTANADPEMVAAIPNQTLGGLAGGPVTRNWADAVNVLAEHPDDGQPRLAILSAITVHSTMEAGQGFGTGPGLKTVQGSAYGLTIFSAPADRFLENLPAFYMYISNYRVDPTWASNANALVSQATGDVIRTAGAISRMRSRTNSQINQITRESARHAAQADERMQREVTEMIRDTETYKADTFTGEIELPFGYRRAFQLDDGSFVVTNDEGFNPANELGINGRQLDVLP